MWHLRRAALRPSGVRGGLQLLGLWEMLARTPPPRRQVPSVQGCTNRRGEGCEASRFDHRRGSGHTGRPVRVQRRPAREPPDSALASRRVRQDDQAKCLPPRVLCVVSCATWLTERLLPVLLAAVPFVDRLAPAPRGARQLRGHTGAGNRDSAGCSRRRDRLPEGHLRGTPGVAAAGRFGRE